jgi:hypothetical protein
VTDLVLGNAGVVLAAIWAGGEHARGIAATGGQALLDAADQTEGGLDWAMVPGWGSRMPNYSHGTAGVATALAIAGAALDRADSPLPPRRGHTTCWPWARWTRTGSSSRAPCPIPPGTWIR